MGTTEPIRDYAELEKFRNYYLSECPNPRNYALIMLGLHTALRISDILFLRWEDIYDFSKQTCRTHLQLREHKTGKSSSIALCPAISQTMNNLFEQNPGQPDDFIFSKTTSHQLPLCRSQAYRIVRTAAAATLTSEHISCHSLRKTFGYHAWKQGVPPVLLMDIFNHSSYHVTKRYLGISQDERDDIFLGIRL